MKKTVELNDKTKLITKIKNKLTLSKEDKIFWIRFFLFALFSLVLPVAFISWRYGLFSKVGKVSISGWGLVVVIIVFAFVKYIMKSMKRARPYSLGTQCVTGVRKIILPLLFLYFIINAISTNVDFFQQMLVVLIICEGIAIPFNPMPKYEFDNHVVKEDTLINKVVTKFKEVI